MIFFSLFHIFLSHCFLSYCLFSNSHAQRNTTSVIISHNVYFVSFCYKIYYIVSEICIGGNFLEECFYCYSQQIKSEVANKFLTPYNLIIRAPDFFCLLTWNMTHLLSNLIKFKRAIKTFWIWCHISYWSHYIPGFSAGNLPFTCFC